MVSRFMSAIVVLCITLAASAALAYPAITRPVEDTAGVLSPAEIEDLAARIQSHRAATSVQIAVLTVPSTNGEPISDYSIAVASAWGGGQHGVDNGILVTLAINDHRSRIEVGSGLEARVTDSYASQLLTGAQPSFRARQYGDGLRSIVGALIVATGGAPASVASWHPQQPADNGWPTWLIVLIVIGVIIAIAVIVAIMQNGGGIDLCFIFFDGGGGGGGSSNSDGGGGGGDFGGGGSDGGW